MNNSWGGGGANPWYAASVADWRAASIFPSFAAGNNGPSCGSVSSPGDYTTSFASGATDINDNIAGFSGRGPSMFGVKKPDLSAPGVNIRSSVTGNAYAAFNGTSMATPHTSGIVALLWSSAQGLVRDIPSTEAKLRPATLIRNSTQGCGGDGPRTNPNNMFGSGRIDAVRVVSPLNIYTNQGTYTGGDTLTVRLSLVNPTAAPLSADMYVGLVVNGTPSVFPLGLVVLPPLFEAFGAPIVSGPVAMGTPPTTIHWFALLITPGGNPVNPADQLSADVASMVIQ